MFGSVTLCAIHKGWESKIQQFLGCLPPNFRERIGFDMPKTIDTTLHKVGIFMSMDS